jgi:isocitrate lyase
MGYKFQFVTLAGFHTLNMGMFDLARSYKTEGMAAYARFQDKEFEHEKDSGYMATTHQRFVGASYFDVIAQKIVGEGLSTAALTGSTEEAQFEKKHR